MYGWKTCQNSQKNSEFFVIAVHNVQNLQNFLKFGIKHNAKCTNFRKKIAYFKTDKTEFVQKNKMELGLKISVGHGICRNCQYFLDFETNKWNCGVWSKF